MKTIKMDLFGDIQSGNQEVEREERGVFKGRAPKEKPQRVDKNGESFKTSINYAVEAIARARHNDHRTIDTVYSQILTLTLREDSTENIEKLTYLSSLINPGNYLLTEMDNENLFVFDMKPSEEVENLIKEYISNNDVIVCDQEVTKETIHSFLYEYYSDADNILDDAYGVKTYLYNKYKNELTKNIKSFSTREEDYYPEIESRW